MAADVLAFLLFTSALCWSEPSASPLTVEIPCGTLHLKAFLWKPSGAGPFPAVLFNHGSGGADAGHTAGMPITEAAEKLAPVFVKHGYAFLYPFRRGQGLSAGQAPFMLDLLQREEAAKGKEARERLQDQVLTPAHLEDVLASLSYLKKVEGIDTHRIAVAGHSFGGQLSLLAASRDSTVRAVVSFAAAASSWDNSPERREQLLAAVRKTQAPIMLIHAANDFSTNPGRALAEELERQHKPHVLKIYPAVGQTPEEGHSFLYLAMPEWENDVFQFLDQYVRR